MLIEKVGPKLVAAVNGQFPPILEENASDVGFEDQDFHLKLVIILSTATSFLAQKETKYKRSRQASSMWKRALL